ncbi:hypothetical protein GRAQ_02272, partial [Rahnella aquatilis CIP 78.65 = ATCC 33071]|uniref:zinc ribbon-containing protein n=1 Tax=Rahnella aquatilis TaxID=34038 RepID=UPI0004E46267
MSNITQSYRQLVASLTERLKQGERDISALVQDARVRLQEEGKLTEIQIEQLTSAVRRDLHEFARSYEENQQAVAEEDDGTDSVFYAGH